MEAKDIDDLLDAIYNWDVEILCRYADIDDVSLFFEKGEEEICKIIMRKIENGNCYQYFFDLLKKGNIKLVYLMRYSTKINDIKACIKNRENLRLDSYKLTDLIIGTQDKEYIKNV